jgi:hypothetical protein
MQRKKDLIADIFAASQQDNTYYANPNFDKLDANAN